MGDIDKLAKNLTYPKPDSIFSSMIPPISELKRDCIFVLDTNALLIPYYSSSQELHEIEFIFKSLIERRRLLIPGQVAREFATNRPERIKEVFQQINRRLSTIQEFKVSNYPLLNAMEEYKKLVRIEEEFNEVSKRFRIDYHSQLARVLDNIKEWGWNDPVSSIYRELFKKEVVFNFEMSDKQDFQKELERRYANKIPPGYKDQSKQDDGVGDLLIWFTILEIGKKFDKSVIFVSGEEKADWVIRSDGQMLCPRFELVSEFGLSTSNKSFTIIKFSQFIELLAGPTKLIEDLKAIESKILWDEQFVFNTRNATVHEQNLRNADINDLPFLEMKNELNAIKQTVREFLGARAPNLVGTDNFMDDLTNLHRAGILKYDVYKRLMRLYSESTPKDMTIETYMQSLEELKLLKILAFESLANTFH